MWRRPSVVFSLLLLPLPLFAAAWRPIDPADLASKQSKAQATADVEGLFREVTVSSEQHGVSYAKSMFAEYVRLKIYTDRGKEKYGNVQIPYFGKTNVFNIEGRTVQPDGGITELKKDAIFNKVIERANGVKVNVVSFAMPAIEPGSIIEYKFSKDLGESIPRYTPLEVQTDFPIDEVTFLIKPISNQYISYPGMRFIPFHCSPERGGTTRDGMNVIKLHDVPAFQEEPFSPPDRSARQWILIYYDENDKNGKDQYWAAVGRAMYKEAGEKIKVNGEVKELAAKITAGAASDDEKLAKLADFCRTQIKDLRGDNATTQEMEEAKENKTSVDTLKRRIGTRKDINFAFAALAEAAGFEARVAHLSDRSTFLFLPAYQSQFFLNAYNIAVKVNGAWRFFDVENAALPPGQLRWQEQGVYALITDPKDPVFVETPLLTADQTKTIRMATLTLTEDGTLEGDIREMYWGNRGIQWRQRLGRANEEERGASVRQRAKQHFADFELSKLQFAVSPDVSKPVGVTYHIVVRNYAQRTGKRIFVTPNFFESGYAARFTASERQNLIYFDFPWSEQDHIELKLPTGFVLDHGDAPKGVKFAPVGQYIVSIAMNKKDNSIVYERQMSFGADKIPVFQVSDYPTMKRIFDQIHDSDNYLLTLKVDAPEVTAAPK